MGEHQRELLQGTLDMLILRTLDRGSQHGYGISQTIRAVSKEVFRVDAGSLYPALHRLEKQGLVKSEWKVSDKKQRAKYYRISAAGRRHLSVEYTRWRQAVKAIAALMRTQQEA